MFGNNFIWIFIVICLVVSAILVWLITRSIVSSRMAKYQQEQQEKADNLVNQARETSKVIELEAKDNALKILQESENEVSRRRADLSREEERLQKRRTEIDARVERLEQREAALNKRQSTIDKRSNEIEKLYQQQLEEVQRVAEMSLEEARAQLLADAEKEGRNDMARIIRQIEAEARAEGEKRARDIIADSIQRVASDHVASVSTSIVSLPNEEMKGRIVGRNGRNIRAF
jgi:ribonuclease Y